MATIQNYITALWLIAYLPKMAYLYVRENWRMLATVAACLVALFAVSYHLGKDGGKAVATSASSTYDGGGFGFVDLSAAFATGEKRTMQVELIAIHHTAGNPNGSVNDLAKIHLGQNKWNSVGYHFYIVPDGTVYQLRPLDECVPHAYGCNGNSIAICLAGNFNEYEPTDAQRTSALQLCRWLMKKYGLTADKVKAHGELTAYSPQNATDCCGKMFNIQKFRNEL
jgi:N-acetylmuramoyl-L-alanine amidase